MSSAISRGLVDMETLLPVGDVELCVDTVGSPTDIPLLLNGTTVATSEPMAGSITVERSVSLRDVNRLADGVG
jgi:hypothetical protein